MPLNSAISSGLSSPVNANLTAIKLAFGSPACFSAASIAFTSCHPGPSTHLIFGFIAFPLGNIHSNRLI
jgi:hypothetical protein